MNMFMLIPIWMLAQTPAPAPKPEAKPAAKVDKLTPAQSDRYMTAALALARAQAAAAQAQAQFASAQQAAEAAGKLLQALAGELKASGCELAEDNGKPICKPPEKAPQ